MTGLLVACLCAAWCDTCQDYRAEFEALGRANPRHRLVWIDIEDQADLVHDIDVETFPTLLIADYDGNVRFAGTLLPHIGHLQRLLKSLEEASETRPADLSVADMAPYRKLALLLLRQTNDVRIT